MDIEELHAEHGEHVETEEIEQAWHIEREETEHVQIEETEQVQPCASAKLPVFRSAKSVHDKGKGIADKQQIVNEDDSDSDSDRDYDVPPEESNSSADDDEVIEYRKYAQEFKEKRRKKMLGEEQGKTCNVPDNFIVPETCKIDEDDADETPYFESDDDEASDGEPTQHPKRSKSQASKQAGASSQPTPNVSSQHGRASSQPAGAEQRQQWKKNKQTAIVSMSHPGSSSGQVPKDNRFQWLLFGDRF